MRGSNRRSAREGAAKDRRAPPRGTGSPGARWLLVLALAIALLAPAGADARSSQVTIFEAPRELLSDDAGLRDRTLREIAAFGVERLRVILYWQSVAPSPDARRIPNFDERDPAAYPGFGRYDRLLAEARAHGLRVLLTVSGPVPRWASRGGADHLTNPSAKRFERFVTAVGRRYRDVVDMWAIWNEPNHPGFLRPQFSGQGAARRARSPALYRRLFQAGERGLQASGNGRDRILMGETAPRGTRRVVAPLAFLRGTLCLSSRYTRRKGCHRLPADGYAHHAYTTRLGPYFKPPARDDVTIGVLHRLNRALHRAGRTGAIRRGMAIYLTEFGIQSTPDPIVGVSETRQAEYLAISEKIAYRNRRVASFSQYLMRDSEPTAGVPEAERYGGFESGLRHSGGDPKRAYDAFRLPLVVRRGVARRDRVYLWGHVRPSRAVTSVSIDIRSRTGRRWHFLTRERTDARGFWSARSRYRAGRRYRVRWTAPDGEAYAGPLTRVTR